MIHDHDARLLRERRLLCFALLALMCPIALISCSTLADALRLNSNGRPSGNTNRSNATKTPPPPLLTDTTEKDLPPGSTLNHVLDTHPRIPKGPNRHPTVRDRISTLDYSTTIEVDNIKKQLYVLGKAVDEPVPTPPFSAPAEQQTELRTRFKQENGCGWHLMPPAHGGANPRAKKTKTTNKKHDMPSGLCCSHPLRGRTGPHPLPGPACRERS